MLSAEQGFTAVILCKARFQMLYSVAVRKMKTQWTEQMNRWEEI